MQAARRTSITSSTASDPTGRTQPGPNPAGRTAMLVGVAALVLVADVVTKMIAVAKLADRPRATLIPHVLWLTFTRNAGAAFSVGTGTTWIFTGVAVVVVVVIVRTSRALR